MDYPKDYHRGLCDGAVRSAREVVPCVFDYVRPATVIDVGCGTGAWLSVFAEHGIEGWGVDGEWIERESLLFPAERFTAGDLERPLDVHRQFDLVVSLEVGEHLRPQSAEIFVESLTRLGPVLLFSAAVPQQGGTHHVNEQWPDYWVARFARHGYVLIDCLRTRLWDNDRVEWWYAQNTMFYARHDRLDDYPGLGSEYERGSRHPLSLVHPRGFLERIEQSRQWQWGFNVQPTADDRETSR